MPNRLIDQTSPYLLQHAHNPVDWFPWGEEALQKAKDDNKVILVSIGYSACHWCHVMERESFENEDTARLMNENFINIKIDREERPDLDQVYMDAVQLVSGSGGWPLNVFLTPDAKPFYGGTYFPPVPAYNRSSWKDVLTAINTAWLEKPEELVAQAENLTDHLQKAGMFNNLADGETRFSKEDFDLVSEKLLENADPAWGGFGNAPKFPQTFSIQYLLRQHYYQNKFRQLDSNSDHTTKTPAVGHSAMLSHALLSIDKMIMGGIYDQLAGGFARYSTDAQWLAPHFEKMLYDNALLISVISEAYQLTGKPLYLETIQQTMQFIKDEWQDSDGGFFSAYDADSEGIEGKFYTWSKKEIAEIIVDPEALDIFTSYYGVEETGNWEHTNILWVQQPLEIFCTARGLELAVVTESLRRSREKLLVVRNSRIKPLLDDKKLMSWNSLMITACCKAWAATGIDDYLAMAVKASDFIEKKLKSGVDVYHHNYKNGIAANPAFLEDIACYIQALCHLQECTGNIQYLETARRLTIQALDNYQDTSTGFFFYTHQSQTDIIFRKKDMYDGATPSGNSLMAYNLLYLGTLYDIPAWKDHASQITNQMKNLLTSYPGSFAIWAQVLQALVYGMEEIAIVGEKHKEVSAQLLKYFIPNKILQQSATSNMEFPLLAEKALVDNKTAIYLCYQYSCKQPVEDPRDLIKMINSF
ncbi:MAG: thioredoxin domain-containing protein [Bacteroidota bacterium]